MAWNKSEGKEFAPIVQIEDGEELVVGVVEIRENTGPFDSTILDLSTLRGTVFSVAGHAILADKIQEQLAEDVTIFRVQRDGVVGRAAYYDVDAWKGTVQALEKTTEGKALIESTEALVQAKLDSLPPRD